jgi:hypothetical protein
MAKLKKEATEIDRVVDAVQDLFILQALQAGAQRQAIRKMMHVGQWRVVNISNLLKTAKNKDKD